MEIDQSIEGVLMRIPAPMFGGHRMMYLLEPEDWDYNKWLSQLPYEELERRRLCRLNSDGADRRSTSAG